MKAILMLNKMPNNCMECPYRLNTQQYRCGVLVDNRLHNTKWIFREDVEKHRYSKCPLLEINDNLARLIEVAK